MRRLGRLYPLAVGGLLRALIPAAPARAELAVLGAGRDNTLIEDAAGALSNGAGPHLFSGRTSAASNPRRRALVRFDVAAAVPPGSVVTRATLTLHMSQTNAGAVAVEIHPLEADWGEGISQSSGGGGAPASPGDATWIHNFYDIHFWARGGGDFAAPASAVLPVDQVGFYAWGSEGDLVADVQRWVDDPAANFGWILLGDESFPTTVKRFDSREHPDEALRPRLEVEFAPPCVPRFAGPGYWRGQCAGNPGEPGFEERVLPCADDLLRELGIETSGACAAVAPEPPLDCTAVALRKLATLAFNLCTGRQQASCPIDPRIPGCPGTTAGEQVEALAERLRSGDCRTVIRCAGFGR